MSFQSTMPDACSRITCGCLMRIAQIWTLPRILSTWGTGSQWCKRLPGGARHTGDPLVHVASALGGPNGAKGLCVQLVSGVLYSKSRADSGGWLQLTCLGVAALAVRCKFLLWQEKVGHKLWREEKNQNQHSMPSTSCFFELFPLTIKFLHKDLLSL